MILLEAETGLGFLDTCDPRIREIYAYWDGKRLGRRMPSRADLDPVDIPSFLPNVILADVLHDPVRFRYRLVGTDIVDKRGFDPTGKPIGDVNFGKSKDFVLALYRDVIESRRVKFVDVPYVEPRGWYVYSERLLMPLSDDDDRVNMVFIYALWKDAVTR